MNNNANLIINKYYNVRYKVNNYIMNNTTKQFNYPYEYYITNGFQFVTNKKKTKYCYKEPYKDKNKQELIQLETHKKEFKNGDEIVKQKKKYTSNVLNNKYNEIIQYSVKENDINNNQKKTYCVNCGKNGHIFRKCLYPILSYGLIAYYIDKKLNEIFLIMIQSKNTFSYLDFICGKYDICYDGPSVFNKQNSLINVENPSNKLVDNKLHYLFSKMTQYELIQLKNYSFEENWENTFSQVFNQNNCGFLNNKNKIFQTSLDKYNLLKKGFYNLSLDILIEKYIQNNNNNISWSFPKGRRNYKESDLNTAIREFEEETNINRKFFEIKEHKKIFKENYIGDNLVKYEHRYYLAQLYNKHPLELDPNNIHQKIEVGKLEWVNIKDAKNLIDNFYTNRLEIIDELILEFN